MNKLIAASLLLTVVASASVLQSDTCSGRCGSSLDTSHPCQCNDQCTRFGDCCGDYQAVCNGQTGDTCAGRCGDNLDVAYPCQCNDDCGRFGDCCSDYGSVCSAAGSPTASPTESPIGSPTEVTDADIENMGDVLWSRDVYRLREDQYRLNVQRRLSATRSGQKLFEYVDDNALVQPSYALFIALLDNYNAFTRQLEPAFTANEQLEVEVYLGHLIKTSVMGELRNFLITKGIVRDPASFQSLLQSVWFDFYPRSSSATNILDSSGFEHVFVGEKKSSSVTGFHSWVQMYQLESNNRLNYLGYNGMAEPDLMDIHLEWDSLDKPRASMFIGTSPEFDMALYTLCMVTRPGKVCTTSILGHTVRIQTYDVSHVDGIQVASSFPMIG